MENKDKKMLKLVQAALFAAVCCVSAMLIHIPIPGYGYIHPADAVVMLSGALLGPLYGGLASGIGMAMTDLFLGYGIYVPATLIIKALMAIAFGLMWHKLTHLRSDHPRILFLLAGIVSVVIMAGGYFAYEIVLYGFEAAFLDIPYNLIQGAFGIIVAALLYPALRRVIND